MIMLKITTGNTILILTPNPTKSIMSGDIPLIKTKFPVIEMKKPVVIIPVPENFKFKTTVDYLFPEWN